MHPMTSLERRDDHVFTIASRRRIHKLFTKLLLWEGGELVQTQTWAAQSQTTGIVGIVTTRCTAASTLHAYLSTQNDARTSICAFCSHLVQLGFGAVCTQPVSSSHGRPNPICWIESCAARLGMQEKRFNPSSSLLFPKTRHFSSLRN